MHIVFTFRRYTNYIFIPEKQKKKYAILITSKMSTNAKTTYILVKSLVLRIITLCRRGAINLLSTLKKCTFIVLIVL